MNKLFVISLVICIFTAGLHAQRSQDIDSRVKRMTAALELSDKQAAEVKKVFETAEKEKEKAAESPAQDRKARRAAARERNTKTLEQLRKILTEEQYKKYEKFSRRPSREEQSSLLKERLKLNKDQAEKFDKITAESKKQREEIFNEPGERSEKFKKFRKIREVNNETIRALLNDEQKKEFEKFLDEQRREMEKRRQRSGME